VFRVLHPTIGFWIADLFSRHLADSTKDRAVLDAAATAQRKWAADLLARRPDLSLVIMAHTHDRSWRPSPTASVSQPGSLSR